MSYGEHHSTPDGYNDLKDPYAQSRVGIPTFLFFLPTGKLK